MKKYLTFVSNKAALLLAIALAALVGGVTATAVLASIPDSNGLIHGCIRPNNENLRVIDTGASQSCSGGQVPITWESGVNNVRTINSNSNVTDGDDFIVVDITGGDITVTLPTAIGRTGKIYTIKSSISSPGSNSVFIAPQSGETVDGVNIAAIGGGGAGLTLFSDGSNWFVQSSQ